MSYRGIPPRALVVYAKPHLLLGMPVVYANPHLLCVCKASLAFGYAGPRLLFVYAEADLPVAPRLLCEVSCLLVPAKLLDKRASSLSALRLHEPRCLRLCEHHALAFAPT